MVTHVVSSMAEKALVYKGFLMLCAAGCVVYTSQPCNTERYRLRYLYAAKVVAAYGFSGARYNPVSVSKHRIRKKAGGQRTPMALRARAGNPLLYIAFPNAKHDSEHR